MKLLRRGAAAATVVALAGCGSHANPQRDAVNTYFDHVDRVEAGLVGSSGEIDRAFGNFRLSGNTADEIRELTFARDRIGSALSRLRALTPPTDARRVHTDLVRLLTLQHAAAAELLHVVRYQPRFERALAPLAPAGKALAKDIRQAAKTQTPPPAPSSAEQTGAGVWAAAGCSSCHTLTAAGAAGSSGPNLDVSQLTPVEVAAAVRKGGGGMPSYAKRLKPADVDALATFVSAAEAREAASSATIDAYAAAFDRYRDVLAGILSSLGALTPPPVLRPTLDAELRTLRRAASLSGQAGAALTRRDVPAANLAIRHLFATAASASAARTHAEAAAAVRAYNGRLREIASLSARVVRERQRLVQLVG